MGMEVFIGMILILVLLISAPIIFFILRKKGKQRLGLFISGFIIIFCFALIFMNKIDSFTHTKSDVKEDLKLAKIEVLNDFEILSNKVTGMPERYQETKLKISKEDTERIIKEIKNGENFKISSTTQLLRNQMWNGLRNKIVSTDYKFDDFFVRESYYRKNDYVPILTIVMVDKKNNTIMYERIED